MIRFNTGRIYLRGACAVALGALAATIALSAPDFRVVQKNQQFSVQHLAIRVGDRVTFVNDDTVTHNVYSDTAGLAFEIELQPPGRSDTVTWPLRGERPSRPPPALTGDLVQFGDAIVCGQSY